LAESCTDLVFAVRHPLSAPTWEKPMVIEPPPPPPPPPLPHAVIDIAVRPARTSAEILFNTWGVPSDVRANIPERDAGAFLPCGTAHAPAALVPEGVADDYFFDALRMLTSVLKCLVSSPRL
jgi:hypothetical protein